MAIKFRPVRGKEESIDKLPIKDGYFYLATDSGKIFADVNNKRIVAGGAGASLFYVNSEVSTDTDTEGVYELKLIDSDENPVSPKVNDLLINIADGGFYKVEELKSSDSALCIRLAVSGTGGGSGTTYSPRAKLEKIDPESSYLINGRQASIKIKAISGKDPEEGTQLDEKLTIYWSLSEITETGVEVEYAHNSFPIDASTSDEEHWIEFEYGTKARNSTTNVLKMYAKGSSSTESRSFSYEFHTTELKLLSHSSFTNNNIYSPNDVTIYSTLVGNVDKYIYYYFDEVLLNEGGTLLQANQLEPTYHVDSKLCTHGNHTVRIEVYQSVNGIVDKTSGTEPIEMEIAVVDPADERPVIWLGNYAKEYYQYDSIKIPYNVYDPKNSKDTLVRFFKNSTKLKESTVSRSTAFSTFEIVNADLNELNYYYIKAGEVELAVEREISFKLSEDPNRKDMKINTDGLLYSFTASGHSNSDSATNRTKDSEGKELGIFEGFNWYSNGWDKDEDDGNAILRISNNAKFKYNLGAIKFATTKSSEQSHTFEFQFKIRNVQDYANIVHNITRYQGLKDDRYTTYPTWTDLTGMPDNNFVKSTRQDANGNTVIEYYGTFDIWDKKLYLQNNWAGRNFVYENYDAFLQWFLPYFAEKHPDLNQITTTADGKSSGTMPPSYDDVEFRKIDKILTTDFAAGKYYDGSKGILLGAQDAIFTNGTDTVNVSYVEDKLINLTVVYSHGEGTQDGANMLMSIYLNGVLTGVSRSTLYEGDSAVPWTIGNGDTCIEFNSQYCDFELYKIRYYNRALNIPEILTNYAVDLKDVVLYDETTQLAISNKDLGEYQFSYDRMIAYNNAHPDEHLMPYIVFDTEVASDGDALPYSKATPIYYVNMSFVNPALDRAYVTGRLKALAAEAGQTEEEYYIHHCPSWTAKNVDMSVQGTSSEFYPRRNYKAKTQVKLDEDGKRDDKNGKKQSMMRLNRGPFAQAYVDNPDDKNLVLPFFYYDNNTVGTSKFTLKIDYMESSGSYNMGFANLVKNAYTHHPLWYYNKAGAFVTGNPAKAKEITPTSYDENKQYNYYNHKGNIEKWINKELDGLHIYTAEELATNGASYTYEQQIEAFLKGPRDLGILQGVNKVLGGNKATAELSTDAIAAGINEDCINKWYEVEPATYNDYQFTNLDDYRTSVQGIRTLAFHRKKDGSITFIGMYNMLVDKGSDEAFGFKPLDKVKSKYVLDSQGNPKDLADVAECWEFENNSRGFCSFRDAATNRTDNKFFDTGTYTAKQAPVVADYFEYRYSCYDDALDVIYNLSDELTDADSIKTVKDAFGVDISDPTEVPGTTLKKGILDAGEAMLGAYANWEKAVRWVWETNQDVVPSMGTYSIVSVGAEKYKSDTYYLEDTDGFIKATGEFDNKKIYYKKNDDDTYSTIKLAETDDLVWAPAKFYILSDKADASSQTLDLNEEFNALLDYYKLTVNEEASGAQPLPAPVTYGSQTYNYDTKEYRNAKFVNDLDKHFNIDYLSTYFVMTEVFECYDSRGKNAMFASWGPMEKNGDYIWFPIFYDIDTQLGINNTGIPSFEYFVDATEGGCYSTNDSLLWNNFYKNFKSTIIQKYRQLKNKKSTLGSLDLPPLASIDRIENWYRTNPEVTNCMAMEGDRPLIAVNLDEYYKYISITNSKIGYQNRNGGDKPISYDNGTFFYALQGDRSLSRQQFLTNRINYIDSWLNQGNYERGGDNVIVGRIAANSPSNTSDKWIEEGGVKGTEPTLEFAPYWKDSSETQKTHMFDAEYWINMSPVRNSYVTVGTDAANFPSLKYTGEPVKFLTPDLENGVRKSGGYHEQLYYIYGIDQMKTLGDMSKLYWTEFKIEGQAKKMTELLLGYDGKDEEGNDYNNKNINMYGIHASTSITDNGGMPLLKKVNLSNITFNEASPTYAFTSCDKLEDFRAIGSNIAGLTFAKGNNLKVLYLPETLTGLSLTECANLNNIVTTYTQRDDTNNIDVTPGLYIPGLTDGGANPTSKIAKLSLENDHMGYDSYKLLKLYATAREDIVSGSAISLTEVNWCPYKQLDEGSKYIEADANLYFVDSGHYTFEHYNYNESAWANQVKNGEIYKLNQEEFNTHKDDIVSFELLEKLLNNENFKSAYNSDEKPYISGIIYVNLINNMKETDIKEKIEANYPKLKIFCNEEKVIKAYSAKFILMYPNGTYELLATDKIENGWFNSPRNIKGLSSTELESKIDDKDFYGWTVANITANGQRISPSSDYFESLALTDPEWYKSNKGIISITTDLENSASMSNSEQFDKWNSTLQENVYDYVFYAAFATHKYKMTFLDGDKSTILGTLLVDAGKPAVPWTKSIPTQDESNLSEKQSYKFNGIWTATNGRPLTAIGSVNTDWTFYPEFTLVEDISSSPLNEEYFSINSNGVLTIKPEVELRGKITIPTKVNDIIVKTISFNKRANKVTGVFFEPTSMLERIAEDCFNENTNLIYFDYPKSLVSIGKSAFNQCYSLQSSDLSSLTNLTIIDEYAFYMAFDTYKKELNIKLPGSLQTLGSSALDYYHGRFGGKYTWIQQKYPQDNVNSAVQIMPTVANLSFGGPNSPSNINSVGSNNIELFYNFQMPDYSNREIPGTVYIYYETSKYDILFSKYGGSAQLIDAYA